ncbi:MAG: nicotinate-nucleotide adenylyltransferase [Verrucomicrobiota bacterium]|nr:nicotinate-nucleotide adenylyltransferase [Verrucomicrobiota bacterium]
MKKIGIYGGTFDPIHHAHLILARQALEELELERVIFVPAAISPHKLGAAPTDASARVQMIAAAIQREPRFALDDLELHRPPPSYTIDTVEEFRRRFPQDEIYYLVGSDNLAGLPTWHRFAELEKLVRFVILDRGNVASQSAHLTVRRLVDISATEIRNRVASGRSVRYLVPQAVAEIIERRALYLEPEPSPQKN